MPSDGWKRARDLDRGKRELAEQARESEHSEPYRLFVPKGATILVKNSSGLFSPRRAEVSSHFPKPFASDETYFWITLQNGDVIAVYKHEVYQGPFRVPENTLIYECDGGGELYQSKTTIALSFPEVVDVDKLGLVHFQTRDGRSIAVPRTTFPFLR